MRIGQKYSIKRGLMCMRMRPYKYEDKCNEYQEGPGEHVVGLDEYEKRCRWGKRVWYLYYTCDSYMIVC